MSDATEEPAWYQSALATTASIRQVMVEGSSVHFRCWGQAGAPGVVLVHGSAAHSRWWDHVAPLLAASGWRVGAIDLTGHGDSDRRPRYTLAGWAAEALAAADALDAAGPPVLVGHSMGGMVTLTAARDDGRRLSGVIAVDATPRLPDDAREARARARSTRRYRDYPSLAAATARFTPKPEQPTSLPYVLAHIARHSFRADADGRWRPKFDPAIYDRIPLRLDDVDEFECPVVVLRAEHGSVGTEVLAEMQRREPEVAVIELPQAHHHVMLDQPLVLVTALRTQLAAWSRTQVVLAGSPRPPRSTPSPAAVDGRPTVTVLDDYQGVALTSADWSGIQRRCRVQTLREHYQDPAELAARIGDSEIVVAMRERSTLSAGVLARLPRLRLLVATGQRNTAVDIEAARAQGIMVAQTTGATGGSSVPELTIGMMIALARNFVTEDAAIRAGSWQREIGTRLAGKRLGLVGLGRLGVQVAEMARPFGMEIVGWSPHLTPERAAAADAASVSRGELFGTSDVISVHMRSEPATRHLIGPAELALMKPTAYLINTSRGPIIDEQALIEVLRAGRIAGAGLDVYQTEPLPPDSPLRTLRNTLLLPHIGYVTAEGYRNTFGQVVTAIEAYLASRPVPSSALSRKQRVGRPRGTPPGRPVGQADHSRDHDDRDYGQHQGERGHAGEVAVLVEGQGLGPDGRVAGPGQQGRYLQVA
jgi:phosphoglycerate dehydrogenase-like enzyme/pimeloyl-ACP methyl ester carboxylesterase